MDDALLLLRLGGVVGGGGAGFPTWKKLEARVQTLLINGAECEPLLKSDQYLMLRRAEALVEAAAALRKIAGAERVILALKAHYEPQAKALRAAIAAKGGPLSLCLLPSVYPVGDEQAVVHAATGRIVPPGSLPGSVGCTVVSVSTALSAWDALHGTPVTRRLFTVAGEVGRPGLYDAPVGTSVADVLGAAGGAKIKDVAILLGGPMMGELVKDPEGAFVTKTCGGVLVLPSNHRLVALAGLPLSHMKNRAKAACIQCRYCTDLCPRYLLGHALYPHKAMRAFAMGQTEPSALLCMECGICELYACPMGLSPRRVQAGMKAELRQRGAVPDKALLPVQELTRDGRQVPAKRLAVQIGVSAYDLPVPAEAFGVSPARVRVPLKQHIGAPARPVVAAGDRVMAGQTVGCMDDGALGADVHASVEGLVTRVDESVWIEREV